MRGFRLGALFGLDIRIDYSWFIIFFLILWTLTAGVFPGAAPGLDLTTYVVMGLAGTLLFFISLLAHEISHSLVARRRGIAVEGITLFVFGGMAHTRMEAERPEDELAIAGVGPLASLLIAGLFALAAVAANALELGAAIVQVANYLAFINLALAIFNLLPGFPLDGGRLFRAGAWKATGDLGKATRWATNGGKVLGYVLIALGLLQVFAGALIGGLWFVFIGWFVRTAAEASFVQHLVGERLRGIPASELMTPDPETVAPDLSLQDFVDQQILRGRHKAYPVAEGSRPVGVVSLEQAREVDRDAWARTSVRDVMTPLEDAATINPDEDMASVLERLGGEESGRILVVDRDAIRGIITRGDLARWMQRVRMVEG